MKNEGKTSINMNKRKRIKKNFPKYQTGYSPQQLQMAGIVPAGGYTVAPGMNGITSIGPNTGVPLQTGGIPGAGAMNIATAGVDFLANQITDVWASPQISQQPAVTMAKGPIAYQKSDYVNTAAELNNLGRMNTASTLGSVSKGAGAGAAIGSVVPGVGTVVGGAIGAVGGLVSGIFGGSRKKRKLKRMIADQNRKISNINQFNLSEAHSGMLQQEYLQEYGDTQDDVLYNKGKTARKCNDGMTPNAWVGNGETIVDGNTGELEEVTQGAGVGIDDVAANIQPEDAIAGNLTNPRTGNTFAEDMKPLTRMEKRLKRNADRNIQSIAKNTEELIKAYTQPLAQQILADQAMVHYNMGKLQGQEYNDGKSGIHIKPENRGKFTAAAKRRGMGVQEFASKVLANKENYSPTLVKRANFARNAAKWKKNADGQTGWGNIADILGNIYETGTALAPSLYNLYQGSRRTETVRPDQLYSPNARLAQSMNLMAQRRYNVQPQIEALRGLERRSRYNARQLGSESGISRAMDVAGNLNLQRAIQDVYGTQQNIENQYLADRAQMGAQYGAQDAARLTSAMQQSQDINARARAARKAYTAAGLTGISEYSQMQRRLRNQQVMDAMRQRALEQYLAGQTTQSIIDNIMRGQ